MRSTLVLRSFLSVCLTVLLLAAPSRARAADVALWGEQKVEIHGFVSPGFIITTGNNYLAKSKRGSFEFTEVGLNFTVPLTDRLRTGVQFFARDLGPTGNFTTRPDWFYLDYRFDDWLGVRAGRVKIPFGLYNDTVDVDAGRVPILLPQSIYSLASRDFLLAQTGGEAYGRMRMGALGAFEYRLYGGTIFLAANSQSTVQASVRDIDVPFVAGERLMWETPLEGLRLGGSLQALRFDLTLDVPPGLGLPPGPIPVGVPAVLWVGSAEYVHDRLLLAAEYNRQVARIDTPLPALRTRSIGERGYVMAAYRVTDWFHPGAYYSLLYPDISKRAGKAGSQHDVALTLRFDINRNWLVKLEGHLISGTAELDTALNDGKPLSSLERTWGAFLVKTTAHF